MFRPSALYFYLCLLFAVPFCMTQAFADTTDGEAEIIQVGSELDFYPYAFVNKDGEPDGFSVDLIKAVAQVAGLKLHIRGDKWDTVWNELVEGKIDVLPLVGKLPERAAVVEFSTPHTGILDAFFVRKGESPITTLGEARSKTVVVMRSDVAHHKLLEIAFEGTIVPVATITEGLKLVSSGQHDAFLGPMLMANLVIKDNHIENLTSEKPVADYLRIQAFAVKKGDFKLLESLNHGLEVVKSNGEYTKIYNKWLIIEDPSDEILNYGIAGLAMVAFVALVGSVVVSLRRRTRPGAADDLGY